MAIELSRPAPLMRPEAYKTFAVASPLPTHWRKATCAEVDCPHYLHGWRTRVENLTPELLHEARTARFAVNGRQVTYRYVEQRVAEGETYLVYQAGQPCFAHSRHRIQVGRPPLFLVRNGDYRTAPRNPAAGTQMTADNWVDNFREHQQRIADEIEKG